MPKEIAHNHLARLLASRLPEKCLFHAPIQEHFHFFLYGAMVPDSFYFYIAGPKVAELQALSNRFHRSDEKSLEPLIVFLDHFQTKSPEALAFAAGICCHLIADSLFHPMVFYFCGMEGLHAQADARHRAFETAMDIHFWALAQREAKIQSIFRTVLESGSPLRHFLNILFDNKDPQIRSKLLYAVKSHQLACLFFKNQRLYSVIRFLHQYRLGISAEYETLFYPCSKPVRLPFFSNPVCFHHPVTGKLKCATIHELIEQSIEQSIELLMILEETLIKDDDLFKCMFHRHLPKIETNISKKDFRYWLQKKNIHPVIYKGLFNK